MDGDQRSTPRQSWRDVQNDVRDELVGRYRGRSNEAERVTSEVKAYVPVGSVIEDDALDLDQARMEMPANMLFPDLRSQIDGHEIELDPTES